MSTEQNLEAVVWVQRRALTQDAEGTGEGGKEGGKKEGGNIHAYWPNCQLTTLWKSQNLPES